MINNFNLKNRCVLLENPSHKEEKLKSGLILPSTRKKENDSVSIVIAVAPDCHEVKVGDKVCFNKGLKETIGDSEQGDAKYLIVKEENIHFIIHEN